MLKVTLVGLCAVATGMCVGCVDRRGSADGGGIDAGTIDAGPLPDGGPLDSGGSTLDAGGPTIATCRESCGSVDDCASATAVSDADNWTCDGMCNYLGCNSDTECQSVYGASGGTWVCAPGELPACVQSCGSVTDCASASVDADADNWACDAGHCRYTGCNSDTECQEVYGPSGGTWVCAPGALPTCVQACSSPADCATTGSAVSDTDNWTCDSGRCRYGGCNSDAECQSAFAASGGTWTCR